MNKKHSGLFFPLLMGAVFVLATLINSSCKKEKLLQSGGELRFSTDTLTFDTVFTSLGSATIGVKIFNPQSEKINISSIRLAGGSSSPFHLNVDGKAGDGSNIEVAANDSIYVYATVKVDPTDENTPFVIEDKLVATLNGHDFSIPVMAYGQNAHYIRDSLLQTQTWKTDKPYVVIGVAVVDTAQTLTIPAGCRIYMHANARLFAFGKIIAQGTKKDSIIFQGDRLDRSYFGYEGYPGEWGGLYFFGISKGNILEHVIIANCGNGAQGAPPSGITLAPGAELTMSKTIIQNSIGYGILAFNGTLTADNCLVNACGATALALLQGGTYNLTNCTFTTYGSNKINHTENPVAAILNYYYYQKDSFYYAPLDATLRNCVVEGSLENEFVADTNIATNPASQLTLTNCLIKADPTKIRPWVTRTNVKYTLLDGTLDPQFKDQAKNDFHPKTSSPLINGGVGPVSQFDLDENPRLQGSAPDIGCYEVQ
jgi:hypothetical protein